MTRVREIIMATLGLLPVAANAASPSTEGTEEQQRRPNIIFIMCDDMGYGDLGCYGQQRIETPNLDRMAQEGMRFTQAYAGSPVSAPSRASFMTGQHTGHTHVRGNREYWRSSSRANMYGNNADYSLIGQEPYLMNHKIIPEVMKEAGYNTGMFGKWAGGYYNTDHPNTYLLDANGNSDTSKSGQSSSASLPNKRGIDCYYGYICQFQAHTYYPNFLNRYDPEKYGDKHVVVDVLEENIKHKSVATGDRDFENRSQYTSDLIHQYALEWIDRQAEKDDPFLGIFTYTLPHAELWQPQDSLVAKYKEKFKGQDGGDWGGEFGSWYYRAPSRHAQFAAMISRLDAQVGEIFEKLEEKGIADNTLVIFTSDNGPHTEGGADPTWFNSSGNLRGTKRVTHEGGVRVPFIAKGPGVPAGVVNDHQLAFYDVMPTLLDYAGENGGAHSLKASTAERPYDGISFYNTLTGNDAEQEKHEFLYWEFHETDMMALRQGNWKLVVNRGTPSLYDLSTDPHEDNNVASKNPTILRQMIEILHEQHTESSMFRVTLPAIPEDGAPVEVTQVSGDKLYTIECQAQEGHTAARFIGDTNGALNGQTAKGTKFRFEAATGGGYYIKSAVSGKYINGHTGDITFDAEAKSAWTIGQINTNDAHVYFTLGEGKYLNNYNGGADNLRLASHNPIAQTNYCSLWKLYQYDDESMSEGLPQGYVVPDAFRAHKYDLFKVLPVNNSSIVFVGNSITNMNEWNESFGSNANILNRGVWGTFINETVAHIEAVAVGKPQKVFFMIGTNDLGKNGSRNINVIVEDTRVMVDRLQRVSPSTEIYIQSILPSVYNRELAQLQETNERLKALCKEYNVTYVDLWDDLISLTTDQTHTLDGLHLKASGYQVWTKKIESLVGASTVYPDDCATAQSTGGISNTAMAMRGTIFSMLPVNEGDILIIGDEMIHGGAWSELLGSSKVKNRGSGWGYPGPNLDVMLQEIPLILNKQSGSCLPSKVLLYGGVAELNGSSALDDIESKYMAVINSIKQHAPEAKICLMSPQPTATLNTNVNRVVPFNERLKAIAQSDEKVEYIDIYTDFAKNNVSSSSYFSNSYLNAMGYVKVAQKIAEALSDEKLAPLSFEAARTNYRMFEFRSALGNALASASLLKEGNGAGEYSATALADLNALVDEAYDLLSKGGSEAEFSNMATRISSAANAALKGINQPQLSNKSTTYWYNMYTPNRGSRYITSNGDGAIATGNEANAYAKSQWKLQARGDGSVDIINREDNTYLNPNAEYNTAIYTTAAQPDAGWTFEYSNSPGLYIIKSGSVQLNQTQANLGWKLYNWSEGGAAQDRNDTGCQYKLDLVIAAPEEEVIEPVMHFSFARGTSMDNTVVYVTDAQGEIIDGISAQISAQGASTWLTTNKAAADSILCVNKNTSTTSAENPIVYTLKVSGVSDNISFTNFKFRSVALNASGQWQNYTEIRHCNFLCSYGSEESGMTDLPMIVDESIMVANGTPKLVSFDVENAASVNGALTIKFQLYKGTNNGGCFYGLTGITLTGEMNETTNIASPDAGTGFRDGIYLQDEEIVIIRNNQRYNLKGQKLR